MQDIRVIPDSEHSAHPAPAGKHFYTDKEKEVMRTDPEKFLKYRKGVDSAMQASFPIFIRQSAFHDWAITMMTDTIKQRIGEGRPDLEKLFIPSFSPGCRRNTVNIGSFYDVSGLTLCSLGKDFLKPLFKIVRIAPFIPVSLLHVRADHLDRR